MLASIPAEIIAVAIAVMVFQYFVFWRSRNAAKKATAAMSVSMRSVRELTDAIETTGKAPDSLQVSVPLVASVFRRATLSKQPLSLQDAGDVADFFFEEQLLAARSGITWLPLLGLLATFLGMGVALASSADAQGQLNQALSAPQASIEGSGGALTGNFEADADSLRRQIRGEMQQSTEGLRQFVAQQQLSLGGMGAAVSASIVGIFLSLLLQYRSKDLDHMRRALVESIVKLSELTATTALRYREGVDDLSTDELLRALIVEVRQFAHQNQGGLEVAQKSADALRELLQSTTQFAQEVHTLAGQARQTDSNAAALVTAATEALNALAPTAAVAKDMLLQLKRPIADLQESIEDSIKRAEEMAKAADQATTNFGSATERSNQATNRLEETVADIKTSRDLFRETSGEVTGRVGTLIEDHQRINEPVTAELRSTKQSVDAVNAALGKLDKRMGVIDNKMATSANLDAQAAQWRNRLILGIAVTALIAWAVGRYRILATPDSAAVNGSADAPAERNAAPDAGR
jgi:hypothetical protein